MIGMLFGGGDLMKSMRSVIGKRIAAVALTDDKLRLTFADGSGLTLADEGQNCCENRYMRTDDDLAYFVGAELRGAEVRDAPSVKDTDGDWHDVQFLVIQTDKGDFTLSSHNEHNGYYGGFMICASVEGAAP